MIIDEMNQLQEKMKKQKGGVHAPLTASVLSPKRYTMMLTGKIGVPEENAPQPGSPLSFFDVSKLPAAIPTTPPSRQRSNTYSPAGTKDKNCLVM